MDIKDLLGAAGAMLAIYSYIPYFIGIHRGRLRPHAFSWLIWGVLTAIGFVAQVADRAGPGAWVTGLSALCCFAVAVAAFRVDHSATRSDWAVLVASFAAIPLWVATDDPLWSVILITVIDAIGFWPSMRKAWAAPDGESPQVFLLSAVKFGLSLLALAHFSWVSVLYPASLVVMNLGFVAMVFLRRREFSAL